MVLNIMLIFLVLVALNFILLVVSCNPITEVNSVKKKASMPKQESPTIELDLQPISSVRH